MNQYLYLPKKYLILIAGIVWFLAGFNIVRIGWLSTNRLSFLMVLSAMMTFLIFYYMIFQKLIHKHTIRILSHPTDKMHFLRFFDGKSYLIMFFMMSVGILLRTSHLWPDVCIKSFYTGLGSALLAAGIGFMMSYLKQLSTN